MPTSPALPKARLLILAILCLPLLPAREAAAKWVEGRGEDGSIRYYEVRYSPNRKFFARAQPTAVPLTGGSPVIEVFETKSNPNPGEATAPLWKKSVPGWDSFEVGNAGNTLMVVMSWRLVLSSQAPELPSSRVDRTGVTTVRRLGDGTFTVRRHRIRTLTKQLRKHSDHILHGDVLYTEPGRATYRWYANHRVRGNRLVLRAYGQTTLFHLDTARRETRR